MQPSDQMGLTMIRLAPYRGGEVLRVWCSRCPWFTDIDGWMAEGVPISDVIDTAMRHLSDPSAHQLEPVRGEVVGIARAHVCSVEGAHQHAWQDYRCVARPAPAVCIGPDMDCGRAMPCPDHGAVIEHKVDRRLGRAQLSRLEVNGVDITEYLR